MSADIFQTALSESSVAGFLAVFSFLPIRNPPFVGQSRSPLAPVIRHGTDAEGEGERERERERER